MIPFTILRTRRLPESAMRSVPVASKAMPAGLRRRAETAGPPSPSKPGLPSPHTACLQLDVHAQGILIRSHVVATARTGAEMEALTACAAAALALYDMVKAVERGAVITELRLESKSGGARGAWLR